MRARTSFLVLLLVLTSAGTARADGPKGGKPWPPTGPTWETDPTAAFERARKEKKGVFVYVATEGCPHCVVMARDVWPKEEAIAASGDAVFLAVYRWARDGEGLPPTTGDSKKPAAGDTRDSEWAIRLDVRAYPQVRLLDGWGRPLPSSDRYASLRSAADVAAAASAANREAMDPTRPAAPKPKKALLERLAPAEREAAVRLEPWVRAPVWTRALAAREWKGDDLRALFEAEEDPLVRRAVLERLDAKHGAALASLVSHALSGPNDYVRSAAIAACGRIGGDAAVEGLLGVIDAAVAGRSGWKNPNNVLCDAVAASKALPDPRFVPALTRVLEKNDANNYATLLAVESLVEIGKKHGTAAVKAPLVRARELPGAHQARIRALADGALGTQGAPSGS